jgi:hypothetical protein
MGRKQDWDWERGRLVRTSVKIGPTLQVVTRLTPSTTVGTLLGHKALNDIIL